MASNLMFKSLFSSLKAYDLRNMDFMSYYQILTTNKELERRFPGFLEGHLQKYSSSEGLFPECTGKALYETTMVNTTLKEDLV